MLIKRDYNKYAWQRFGNAVPHYFYRCSLHIYMRYQNALYGIDIVDKFSYVYFRKNDDT